MTVIKEVISKLKNKKIVLLTGPPACGKSTILNQLASLFGDSGSKREGLVHDTTSIKAPIPKTINDGDFTVFASNRKVFRTTFHQNYKNRDFISGIVPSFDVPGKFDITRGVLYEANEYAKGPDQAALLIIDEINRGPAVEIFGGSLVSIEPDKRLSDKNEVLDSSQPFNILCPEGKQRGQFVDYYLSSNLYIIAAMNQADTSITSLDVAFLRRWYEIKIEPDYNIVYEYYKISPHDSFKKLDTTDLIYSLAIESLKKINGDISCSLGSEYQLGPGIFYSMKKNPETIDEAKQEILDIWQIIYTHLEELYFKQISDLGFIIRADSDKSPYKISRRSFADRMVDCILQPSLTVDNILNVYSAIMES